MATSYSVIATRTSFPAARPIRFAAALLLLGAACTSPAPREDPARESPAPSAVPLRWGGDAEGGAPYVEADPADPAKTRGFDVEIAEALARGLGREPLFVQTAWASLEQSVERGDFDLGMSGMEDRPAMRARHAVTMPYMEFRETLAVRAADSARFRRIADLKGRRVATLGATMAYGILLDDAARGGVVPVSYDDDVHPYTDLVDGRVDAVLLDHIIAERALRRLGGRFVVQPEAVATGHYVAVLARGNEALRDSVNVLLRARMRDGTLERIYRKWDVWDSTQAAFFARQLATAPPDERAASVAAPAVVAPAETASERDSESRGSDARGAAAYLPSLLRAAGITVALSFLAMALAVALGIAIAAGRVYGAPVVRGALTVYVEVIRGTPVLLQLFVLYYGLSGVVRLPAFLAAVIGLGLNYAAYESEIYRAALEAIPRLQLEAARTLGLSELQILRLVRGPQALRLALAPMTNDFVALLKDSSLVSVITVVELTKQTAIYATNVGSWVVPGLVCAAMYLAFSLPLSGLARRLERRWNVA
jgi:polar amino acid transport system substrate-binding protein